MRYFYTYSANFYAIFISLTVLYAGVLSHGLLLIDVCREVLTRRHPVVIWLSILPVPQSVFSPALRKKYWCPAELI